MKIAGKTIPRNFTVVPIIRQGEPFLNFHLLAMPDDSEFEKKYPRPVPKSATRTPSGGSVPDYDNPAYKESLTEWGNMRWGWIIYCTLASTPDLVWDNVNPDDATTFLNIKPELEASGMTGGEITYLLNQVWDINQLNEEKVETARQSFFKSPQSTPTAGNS